MPIEIVLLAPCLHMLPAAGNELTDPVRSVHCCRFVFVVISSPLAAVLRTGR
jgi:hypothetical protein